MDLSLFHILLPHNHIHCISCKTPALFRTSDLLDLKSYCYFKRDVLIQKASKMRQGGDILEWGQDTTVPGIQETFLHLPVEAQL